MRVRFEEEGEVDVQRRVFSITGVHGSGKTTVYNSLRASHRKDLDWLFLPERKGRPPFPFGSRDPQIAFRAELWYLRQMLKRNELIKKRNNSYAVILCDRSPVCIMAYSYALCSAEDYKIIRDLYLGIEWMEDATFYLEMNLESTKVRLTSGRRRNLKKWNEGDAGYIMKVLEGYEMAFKEIKQKASLELVRIPNFDAAPKETIGRINEEIIGRKSENP